MTAWVIILRRGLSREGEKGAASSAPTGLRLGSTHWRGGLRPRRARQAAPLRARTLGMRKTSGHLSVGALLAAPSSRFRRMPAEVTKNVTGDANLSFSKVLKTGMGAQNGLYLRFNRPGRPGVPVARALHVGAALGW